MLRSRSLWPLLLAVAASGFSQYPGSTPPPADWRRGFESITNADGFRYLSFLAGPQTMGRGTGQPGYQVAADYVAAHFRQYGLKPIGDNGTYFQNLMFWRAVFSDAGSSVSTVDGRVSIPGGAFRMTRMFAPVSATNLVVELTAAGDTLGIDPADLRRRIVVIRGEQPSMRFRAAVLQANPAAVLFVRPEAGLLEYNVRRTAPTEEMMAGAPLGNISESAANQLLGAIGMASVRSGDGTMRRSTRNVRLVANALVGEVPVPNVVGLLEGSDPVLKNEIVGIGCHLDHLGVSNGQVYPGADDDGSGSAALLMVAKAFHANPVKPKRSILFMAFAAEEIGLVGSRYYSDNPIIPNEQMIALLQMDMVGRNSVGAQNGDRNRIDVESENIDTIRLVGSQRISTDLHRLILETNQRYINFQFKYDAEDVYTRSDHYMFARKGIPVAFFFSGFHPDYHRPTDTVDKINFDKITSTARLNYLVAAQLATNPQPPRRDVTGG
jgi:hypothetical protein